MGMFSYNILCMLPLACVLLTRSSDGKTLEEKVCNKSADCGMFCDVIVVCDARINRCATYQVHYDKLSTLNFRLRPTSLKFIVCSCSCILFFNTFLSLL